MSPKGAFGIPSPLGSSERLYGVVPPSFLKVDRAGTYLARSRSVADIKGRFCG
jgi:hypothetical protein